MASGIIRLAIQDRVRGNPALCPQRRTGSHLETDMARRRGYMRDDTSVRLSRTISEISSSAQVPPEYACPQVGD